MIKPLTADDVPFTLGDTLWTSPRPNYPLKKGEPVAIETSVATHRVQFSQLWSNTSSDPMYPTGECLGRIDLLYSNLEAANEAYIRSLRAAVQAFEKEITRRKDRRSKRRYHLYLKDFDVSSRSPKKQYLTTLSAEGTNVTLRDVVEEFIKVKSELAPVFDRECLTIRGLAVIGEEIEP